MEFGASTAALIVSALCALAYGLYFLRRPPTLLRAIVKTGMMAALAVAFAGNAPPFVPLAFALAALGDFFLAFENKKWALPLGMLSFMLMQLLYMLMFFGVFMLSPDSAPEAPRYALMMFTIALVGGYLLWFWRDPARKGNAALAFAAVLGALAIGATPLVIAGIGYLTSFDETVLWGWPEWSGLALVLLLSVAAIWKRIDLGFEKIAGMVYAALIVQMALIAFWLPWAAWPAMLGALLFIVSDGVLSAEFFRMEPDAPARRITAPVVWWTYAGGQALIALGLTLGARAMQ